MCVQSRTGLRFMKQLARFRRILPLTPPAVLALVPGCLNEAETLGRPPTAPRLVIRSEQGAMQFFEHVGYPVIALVAAPDFRLSQAMPRITPGIAAGGKDHQRQKARGRQA